MDDIQCPRCKTTKYRNPSLKLLVNVCGHPLCETCVEFLFVRGSASCLECGIPLRRSHFRVQTFEDPYIEKEVDIRKRILKEYNKKEEDFNNLNDYNNYLEEIEDIIFNLSNDVDVEETNKKVEEYKKLHNEKGNVGRNKLSKDQELLNDIIEDETMNKQMLYKMIKQEESIVAIQKKRKKEEILDELIKSEVPVDDMINTYRTKSNLNNNSISSNFGSQPKINTNVKIELTEYNYVTNQIETNGPTIGNDENNILDKIYLNENSLIRNNKQGKAGGYKELYTVQRSLQEAFCELFFHT